MITFLISQCEREIFPLWLLRVHVWSGVSASDTYIFEEALLRLDASVFDDSPPAIEIDLNRIDDLLWRAALGFEPGG